MGRTGIDGRDRRRAVRGGVEDEYAGRAMLATHDRRIECSGIKGACVVWISAVDWLRDKSKSHPLAKCTRRLGHAGFGWECWVRERSKCGGVSPRDYGR